MLTLAFPGTGVISFPLASGCKVEWRGSMGNCPSSWLQEVLPTPPEAYIVSAFIQPLLKEVSY